MLPRAIAALLTAGLLAPAAASAGPTLRADHACYLEGQDMVLAGDGYTPGVGVAMFFSASQRVLGTLDATADLAGNVAQTVAAPEIPKAMHGRRIAMTISANDQSKFDPATGAPLAAPEDSAGFVTVELTRADVVVPLWQSRRRFRPGSTTTFDAYGFATDTGRILYAHYVLRRHLVKTVPLGTLTGDCGDVKVRMHSFPFRPASGLWKVTFDTTRAYAARNAYVRYTLVIK